MLYYSHMQFESSEVLQDSLNEAVTNQIGSLTDMLPLLIAGLGASFIIFMTLAILSARARRKERNAILQTASDIRAIKELLENRGAGTQLPNRERPQELKNDPQLPAQP